MIDIKQIDFNKQNGLVPVCIQDNESMVVLMMAFMNQEALTLTITTGRVTFWSRTKNRLWTKGDTSGHYLLVEDISVDCDNDALLIKVNPLGPTCHTGHVSCFAQQKSGPWAIMNKLINIIRERYQKPEANSYTASLFKAGVKRIAQKVGEEGVEVALEAVSGAGEALKDEMADLIFHLLVLMQCCAVKPADIAQILNSRMDGGTDVVSKE